MPVLAFLLAVSLTLAASPALAELKGTEGIKTPS